MEITDNKPNPHIYYHPFIKHVSDKFGEELSGWDCIEYIEEYVKDHPEIEIVRCDDDMFAGSILVLIPHPEMGITVHFIPQLTTKTDNFFLYPNHQRSLLKALNKIKVGGDVDYFIREKNLKDNALNVYYIDENWKFIRDDNGFMCFAKEAQELLKEKEAEIERLKSLCDQEQTFKQVYEMKCDAYSELMERMNTTIREVEVMMEQNNMNDNFDGIWRDSDEEILAATKKLQTDFKNLKG